MLLMFLSSAAYCFSRRSSVRSSCSLRRSARDVLASRLRRRALVVPLRLPSSSRISFRRALSIPATPDPLPAEPESRAAVAALMVLVPAPGAVAAPAAPVAPALPAEAAPEAFCAPANTVRIFSGLFSRSFSLASLMLSAPLRSSSKPALARPLPSSWARTRLRTCCWIRTRVALPCRVPAFLVAGSYFVCSAIRLLTLL